MSSRVNQPAPRSFMELRSPEVREMAGHTEVALIFVTQTAQAGRHLPVGSRYFIAEEMGRRIVTRLAGEGHDAIVGAVLPFGHSVYNACFPGVIQLSPDTLAAVIVEVGVSLVRQGFRKLVILSNAGGNPPAVMLALHRLSELGEGRAFFLDLQKARLQAVKDMLDGAFPERDSHAGEWETSCMLAIAPHLVDMSEAESWYWDANDDRHKLSIEGLSFHDRQMALGVEDDRGWIGPGGTVGDAKKATAEKGNRILDNYARIVAGHIKKWVFEMPRDVAQYGRPGADGG